MQGVATVSYTHLNNSQLIFFVLGFALLKVVGLNVITITIIGGAIAYVIFMIQGKAGENA